MTKRIILWGAAGHAKVLHEALEDHEIVVAALVDRRNVPTPIPGAPVLGSEAALDQWLDAQVDAGELLFAIAVGGSRGTDRQELFRKMLQRRLRPQTIVHRSAYVARGASLGRGCQVLANATICVDAVLEEGVIVNTAASVDHDCHVGAYSHIGPGAALAGEIVLGTRAFVGVGAVILPRVRVGSGAVIGAGAVVTRDVSADSVVVGCPARPIDRKRGHR